MRYDAIVVGLGAAGSAALYQLAKRGAKVLGIDRLAPPHDLGSSHGTTRITRLAIGEGAHYTPLVMRSHEIWREIERETGRSLLTQNGGLVISSAVTRAKTHVSGFFDNTVAAARQFGIAHELLDAGQIRNRFPQFRVHDDETAYFEPEAGFVRPEECIAAELELAKKHGAEILTGEAMVSFGEISDSVRITTDKDEYVGNKAVLSVGAWLPPMLPPDIARLFKIYRQVLYWFDVEDRAAFAPEYFPIFIWEPRDAAQGIYGFPAIDATGLKIATEEYEVETTPDGVNRTVSQSEIGAMYGTYVAPNFIGVTGKCLRTATCLYTVTLDAGFVIDQLPGSQHVILASPCSGHGLKHSAAIGEALAELVLDGRSRHDLSAFRLDRFGA
jgi:sarcosine oxidase